MVLFAFPSVKIRTFFAASDITELFPWLGGFAFYRLRSAPFEGAAIGIPPALPEDCYFRRGFGNLFRVLLQFRERCARAVRAAAQHLDTIDYSNLQMSVIALARG